MNNFFLGLSLIFIGLTVQAQDNTKNALGIRLGDSDGVGFEISYQRDLGVKSRLEADLGWRTGSSYNSFQITGLYQWVMPIKNRFHWFIGAGGGFGSRYYNENENQAEENDSYVFFAGDLGIEYDLNIPFVISFDFRPGFGSNDYEGYDFALGFRYQF